MAYKKIALAQEQFRDFVLDIVHLYAEVSNFDKTVDAVRSRASSGANVSPTALIEIEQRGLKDKTRALVDRFEKIYNDRNQRLRTCRGIAREKMPRSAVPLIRSAVDEIDQRIMAVKLDIDELQIDEFPIYKGTLSNVEKSLRRVLEGVVRFDADFPEVLSSVMTRGQLSTIHQLKKDLTDLGK